MGCENDIAVAGAPEPLELVRSFVNSLDVEEATDDFATTAGLTRWLADHDLIDAEAEIDEADRARATELREALRDVLLAHNGAPASADAYERLNRAIAGAPLEVRFDPAGAAALEPLRTGIDGAIATIAAICREASLGDDWGRLKICPADDCLWAFYDRSRNHSRTWCQMGDCGNRAKVRAYRSRARHDA